jgi:copper chaperone CopZ
MAESLIKKRKFAVTGMDDQENVSKIKEYLNKKTGIIAVDVEIQKGYVRIEYDLNKINFETIEKAIKDLGFRLSQKIAEKFKRGMAKFTEQNELDNLTAAPSSCCEDPKETHNKANR